MIKLFLVSILFLLLSCEDSFLEIKRESTQVIPKDFDDLQALMDAPLMYTGMSTELGTIGSDEYYVPDGLLNTLTVPFQRNGYIWADDIYEGQEVADWDNAYRRILCTNIVLEGLEKLSSNENEHANIKGIALFHRAYNLYLLQQQFGADYSDRKLQPQLGVPIRTESDVTIISQRATIEMVYSMIIEDLTLAVKLLPEKPVVKYRPGKQAAFCVLSKVHLQMGEYDKALEYANKALNFSHELIDYNLIDRNSLFPFSSNPEENKEIIFYSSMTPSTILLTRYSVDTLFYGLYDQHDLRKDIYFNINKDKRILFKGSYQGYGNGANFVGLAVDEILLIKMECLVREKRFIEARPILRNFLKMRHHGNFSVDIPDDELLSSIILERRKELFFRGTRWADLRRLNKESHFAVDLVRIVDGKRHILKPNTSRYLWPIPNNVVELSDVFQNPR